MKKSNAATTTGLSKAPIANMTPPAEAEERAVARLKEVGLSGRLRHRPGELSGGEQQRVALARALAGEPSLLMADEPTGNLNSKQGEEIMDLFKQLNKEGVTIIQVTHSEKNAAYGSHIINLLDGRIEN